MLHQFAGKKKAEALSITICIFLSVIIMTTFVFPIVAGIAQSSVDTKQWKTYKEEERGFQFKYNPRWQMKSIENMVFFIVSRTQSPNITIGVYSKTIEDPSQSLREITDDILNQQALFDQPTYEEGTIAAYPTLLVSGVSTRHVGTNAAYCFVKKEDSLITFTLTGVPKKQWEKHKDNFDAMIASLEMK